VVTRKYYMTTHTMNYFYNSITRSVFYSWMMI